MPDHGLAGRLAFRFAYRSASAIVGVTNAACEYVRNVDKAPRDRVRLIYNCADPRYFPEPRLPVVPKRVDKFTVLLVARLVPVKNHLFFLEAFGPVLRQHPRAELLIAGSGPLWEVLEAKVRELNLGAQVTLLGFRSDVRDLLETAHVFALPSLHEGCSISLIEAMASGVQVIGSSVPGIQEVMGSELYPDWTAPPSSLQAWAAMLHRAVELPETARGRLADIAQRRAYEQFSPTSYMNRVESLYDELLKRAARTGDPRT